MRSSQYSEAKKGVLYGIAAYGLWGLFPIYWKAVKVVPAHEILCHRIVWSFLFVLVLLSVRRRWAVFLPKLRKPKTVLTFFVTASLLSLNWFLFIWSVNSGRVVEASLGYFINPLVNVVLGVFLLRERPRRWQWVAIGIATGGVLYLTLGYGTFPWIGLTLAVTFGTYGFLRKTAALGSLEGLSLETAILFVPAVSCLLFLGLSGTGTLGHGSLKLDLLLALGGTTTATPLLLFASSARRITLISVGLLQYIAPTGQFLLGVFAYGEELTRGRITGFIIIWISLLIHSIDAVRAGRRAARPAAGEPLVGPCT
ncbi:MAG: EamA family transporter RarD [Candidatus Eisenbacteria bacterium]